MPKFKLIPYDTYGNVLESFPSDQIKTFSIKIIGDIFTLSSFISFVPDTVENNYLFLTIDVSNQ